MDEKARVLLIDIIKLLHKHGPDSFLSLSKTISDVRFLGNLESILTETAKCGEVSSIAGKKQQTTRNNIQKQLKELIQKQPVKGQILVDFYNGLTEKKYLRNLRDIREFADLLNLPKVNATSRDRALGPLMRDLMNLSVGDLKVVFREINEVDSENSDRSLAGWSELILHGTKHPQGNKQYRPSNAPDSD
ncbi:MAG: hypothetical protein OXO51_00785 [Gemmatimonadota bacterium]|nr:hypothetical protein [Gemmatimonadota bacterium]